MNPSAPSVSVVRREGICAPFDKAGRETGNDQTLGEAQGNDCMRIPPLPGQSQPSMAVTHTISASGLPGARPPPSCQFQNGRFLSSQPRKNPSFSYETDTITSNQSSLNPLSSTSSFSETPSGPLNFCNATRSLSSTNYTIPPFDVTSFKTDHHQQSWLPTPPPQQPLAPNSSEDNNNNNNVNNPSLQEDFVLFPSAPAPQPPSRDSRAPAPPITTHRSTASLPQLAQYDPRRNSLNLHYPFQQFSGSPAQIPQVARIISQSTGYPLSSSNRLSPSTRTHAQRFHAASVPSYSPRPNRPPVPLFNSTGNLSNQQQALNYRRRIMSTPNIPQDMTDFLDFSNFDDRFESPMEPPMLSPAQPLATNFTPVNDTMAGPPPGTVSPKDLMMDASAPPSASFTDLSTPSFESPGYFSHDTSPLFQTDLELGPGHEQWGPLIHPNDEFFSAACDAAALDVAADLSQPKSENPVASPMIRKLSSPGQSPAPARPSTKHSTVSGVNARRQRQLPDIKYDSSDPVAMKRARNTAAARKSRARKLEKQSEMEGRIAELEQMLEEAQKREQYWKALAENKA